jgi:hypothetical protein
MMSSSSRRILFGWAELIRCPAAHSSTVAAFFRFPRWLYHPAADPRLARSLQQQVECAVDNCRRRLARDPSGKFTPRDDKKRRSEGRFLARGIASP